MANLRPLEKDAIVIWWMAEPKTLDGRLLEGRARDIAKVYHISLRRVQQLIHDYLKWDPTGKKRPAHCNNQIGVVGGKSKLTAELKRVMLQVSQRHLNDQIRCTDRRLQLGMEALGHKYALATIQKWKKAMGGKLKRSYIKPMLTDQQRKSRLEFCHEQLTASGKQFQPPHNKVHIDETWYYVDHDRSRYLVFPSQSVPEPRRAKSKTNLVKVMCLAAIAYPHTRPDGSFFDGKIGIWPLVEDTPAKRGSKNRPAGAPVSTPFAMTAERYLSFYTRRGGIISQIKKQLFHLQTMGIVVQHDGARPHTGCCSPEKIKKAAYRSP